LDDPGLLTGVEEEGKAFGGTAAFDQDDEVGSVSQSGDMSAIVEEGRLTKLLADGTNGP
jgi:hypothetical protein